MRRNSLFTLVLAGASFCFVYTTPGIAQAQRTPDTGSPPMTEPPPRTGAPNGTMGPGQNGQMQTPGDTMPMATKADDQQFVKKAAVGGMLEVQLGKLAQEKGSSDAVKEYGKKLEQDHTKANDLLKEAAAKDGLTVPDSLDSKHQKKIDKLSKLSGEAFDKAFIKDAVKDHEKDISEFKNEAQHGTHANIKNFASETLPVLEGHLSMAKSLKESKGASLTAEANQH
jgi:putative membrane protein